jgi:hypothetical protein
VKEHGLKLRELVFDPLLPALGDSELVVVALDDVLHLVPLDALPLATTESTAASNEDSNPLLGDRWRIESRATLTELLLDSPEPSGTALVALGGASFNVPAVSLSAEEIASLNASESSTDTATSARIELAESSQNVVPAEEGDSKEAETRTQVATVLSGTAWERGFTPLTHTGE